MKHHSRYLAGGCPKYKKLSIFNKFKFKSTIKLWKLRSLTLPSATL